MRLILLLISLLLVHAKASAFEPPMLMGAFSMARVERGLAPFIRCTALDQLAKKIMPFQIRNGIIDHNATPLSIRGKLQWKYLSILERDTGTNRTQWDCYELLAEARADSTFVDVAHVFDNSLRHSMVFYNPRTLWIGYSFEPGNGVFFLVFYAVVIHKGVDIGTLRWLPVFRP